MATNGVILLDLDNRNAAEFNRILVPDSYEKASGALEAGAFVTVYKWLYQGFMMGPSICNAVAETDHINLVDKTNGGILQVYPDDTVELDGTVQPPTPPTPSSYNGYRIRLGHLGYDFYEPYVRIWQANIVNGVEQSVGGDYTFFRFALSFASGSDDYTAVFYNEFQQDEFGIFFTYLGSGLVKVRLYSMVSELSYCQVPESGSPEISDLPARASSTIVNFDIPSDQDWIDILVWRN